MKKQNWSREELEASVRSYLEMRQKDLEGKKYKKKEYYQRLSTQFSRTAICNKGYKVSITY